MVMYTGGTTGFPKGVMHTHRSMWLNPMLRMTVLPLVEDSVALHVAPMFHLAAMSFVISRIITNEPNVYLPYFDPLQVLQTIERERIREVVLVPTMLQMMLEHPQRADYDLSSLKRISYGASPINATVLDLAMQVLPGIEFLHAYGLTENAPLVTLNLPEGHNAEARARGLHRSAGRTVRGMQMKIVDAQGNEVPRGEVGEIIVRGPTMMLGYWNNPDETAKAVRNGWLHTGDAAYMDEEGFTFIVDRVKDMIVTGAENVYSAEVENALAKHPAVAMCAVIGIPHEQWGEAVHAVVTLKPGAVASEDELRAHCRGLIAGYKCPKSVEFRTSMPLSGVGKILKRDLREPYWKDRAKAVN
ncbi:Long-chain-fatty-acid--CoA ligase [compost metagenome]